LIYTCSRQYASSFNHFDVVGPKASDFEENAE